MADFEDTSEKTAIVKPGLLAAPGAQSGAQNPYLIVIAGKQIGKQYRVLQGEMVIGRSPDCQVQIEDDGVSRKHAKVVGQNGVYVLADNGSTNGTFANSQKVDQHLLKDGDKIQIGSNTILKFTVQDSLEEEAQRSLYDSATKDALTGAYNKKFFAERLRTEFTFHARRSAPLTLVLFDIDFFKKVNDTFGHIAGDFVLKKVSQVVAGCLREEDVFARYGGEEFGIILRETPAEKAFIVAERIRRAIESGKFVHDERTIPVTVSLGAATLDPAAHPDAKALLKAADDLLYKAKRGGRNRTESSLM
ncbi:MAG: GGDEF domain-containing protein [Deltaproteobacteria bacterium]|nr:GGDEF domain-containing protein [Deltaproteobacteria bacterium]